MPKKNDDFFKNKKIWSIVKDELLGCYLIPYFTKVFHTRKPILYIDGFAGKGKFDDGQKGSPLTALDCLESSISKFQGQHTIPDVDIKFIELNYASNLKGNLPFAHKQRCEVISGEFEKNIIPILRKTAEKSTNQNVFLYIDPYGVKALNAELFDALPQVFQSAELLINLNSWGFLRMAFAVQKAEFKERDEVLTDLEEYDSSVANTIEEINGIAGGIYWQEIVNRYKNGKIDGYQAEKEFSHNYKLRLREKYQYVLDMPIRLKAGNHPKYRMVYATNHQDGCILMVDNIASRTEYMIVEVQEKGQMSLFEQTGDNEIISQDELTDKVKILLRKYQDYIRLNTFLANFYNEYGVLCKTSKLKKDVLKVLEKNECIKVRRNPKATKYGKPSTFWSDEKGNTVEIKINN